MISTAAVDFQGLKNYAKLGALLALLTVAVSVITGCAATHTAAGALHSNGERRDVGSANVPVVFIGDSITNLWSQVPGVGDPAAFQAHSNWSDQGVIGDSSLFILGRYWGAVLQRAPMVVNIIAGTNDVYPNWVECDVDNMPQFSTCANIAQMVDEARAAHIVPILGTIPPWNCIDTDGHCNLANVDASAARYDRIDKLNAFIKSYGFAQGLIVIDYHTALMAEDGKHYRPELTIDGVHPNQAGYALMTPMVEDAITADSLK